MVTVCAQIVQMGFEGRYRMTHFATTRRSTTREYLVLRILRHLRHLRALQDQLRTAHVRIVHLHTCSGFSFFRSAADAWIARRAGCRVVLHIHGAGFDRFFAEASPLARRLIRGELTRADAVVALSRGWAKALSACAPAARVIVIENAVATDMEDTGDGPALPVDRKVDHQAAVGEACRFLMLARMDAWKGVNDLLTACGILKHRSRRFRLTLAGPEGSAGNAGELARKIKETDLDLFVRYIGPVSGSAKANLWRETDVLVQPSHQEGMPMALLEALARGLPVVATRVGAIPEVLTDGREGRLVTPHAPEELAAALQKIIDDPRERAAMGRAARELAQRRYSLKRMEADLDALYARLLTSAAIPDAIASESPDRASGSLTAALPA